MEKGQIWMGFKAEILRGEGGEAVEQAALGSGAPILIP